MNEQVGIGFDAVDVDFELQDPDGVSNWITKIARKEDREIGLIQYIFCSDPYLLEMNREYLNHDTYTDIITFPYEDDPIRSDIFISVERVKENAEQFKSTFDEELRRVMAHGVLHLCGYKDKTPSEVNIMRSKENEYIAMFNSMAT
ncbi:UNVERIFIED_CONTAM: hypothetical protein GTU68_046522 [Idotea baltica]|nr:hypothetical protein [Idotea baltica]